MYLSDWFLEVLHLHTELEYKIPLQQEEHFTSNKRTLTHHCSVFKLLVAFMQHQHIEKSD